MLNQLSHPGAPVGRNLDAWALLAVKEAGKFSLCPRQSLVRLNIGVYITLEESKIRYRYIYDRDIHMDTGEQLAGSAVPGLGAGEKRLGKVFRQNWAFAMNFSASKLHLLNTYLLNTLLCARHGTRAQGERGDAAFTLRKILLSAGETRFYYSYNRDQQCCDKQMPSKSCPQH